MVATSRRFGEYSAGYRDKGQKCFPYYYGGWLVGIALVAESAEFLSMHLPKEKTPGEANGLGVARTDPECISAR